MASPSHPGLEALLRHRSWARVLARKIAGDDSTADDLVQETYLRAIRRPCTAAPPGRAWFAKVMLNLLRQWRRQERSRTAREQRSARLDDERAAADVVSRSASLELVVRAVLDLPEPYRETVLLRFFEDLPPRAIALRMDVPVNTVKTRLGRAILRLRESLGPEYRGRLSEFGVFLPWLARRRRELGAARKPTFSLSALALGGLLLVGVATSVLVTGRARDGRGTARVASDRQESLVELARAAATLPVGLVDAKRTRLVPEPLPLAGPAKGGAPAWTVRGRVLDANGRAVPGLRVRLDGEPTSTSSRADGAFELETARTAGELICESPGWVTYALGRFRRGGSVEPTLVVAPAVRSTGVVRETSGAVVVGAAVRLLPPEDFLNRFDQPLVHSDLRWWSATTDTNGGFELDACPAIQGACLSVFKPGFEPGLLPAPLQDRAAEVVLSRRAGPGPGLLSGRVVTPDGAPVEGAWVSAGGSVGITDCRGEFALDASSADELRAVFPGYLPAELAGNVTRRREYVELVLGGPPLSIEGVVRDAEGKPRPGIQVWLDNPTLLGSTGRTPLMVEGVLTGAAVEPELLGCRSSALERAGRQRSCSRRTLPRSTATFSWTTTDDAGRFRVGGLLDREYALEAFDPITLESLALTNLPAGARDLELTFPRDGVLPRVSGRVLGPAGNPLSGVTVQVGHDAFEPNTRGAEGDLELLVVRTGAEVVTGPQGRFAFSAVARRGVFLRFTSDRTAPLQLELDEAIDPSELEVSLARIRHLRVQLEEPFDRATAVAALDADGERVPLLNLFLRDQTSHLQHALREGCTPVLAVGDEAIELVFLSGECVVGRAPLQLRDEVTTTVRW